MLTVRVRVMLLSLLIVLAAGCGGGGGSPGTTGTPPPTPTPPTPPVVTGALSLVITDLPTGTPAIVRVTGTNNFVLDLAESQVIANLAPGTYIVTASPVSANNAIYNPSPATQNVTVTGGDRATAIVAYILGGPTSVAATSGRGSHIIGSPAIRGG
jgi:hypothetical protein